MLLSLILLHLILIDLTLFYNLCQINHQLINFFFVDVEVCNFIEVVIASNKLEESSLLDKIESKAEQIGEEIDKQLEES